MEVLLETRGLPYRRGAAIHSSRPIRGLRIEVSHVRRGPLPTMRGAKLNSIQMGELGENQCAS
jgi:hypothetical protein